MIGHKYLPLLLRVLTNKLPVANLTLSDWDLLIRQARSAMLLAKIFWLVYDQNLLEQLPSSILRHLISAKIHAEKQLNDFFWEVRQLERVAEKVGFPLIFLKGSAYAIIGHPLAKGRIFSDIDLLVPLEKLSEVEKHLMLHGWITGKLDKYDQNYYRKWMHEIPPMTHFKRGSVIDLHHNILPKTTPACPQAEFLIKKSRSVSGHEGIKVLSSIDLVIHSATHLFYDGEMDHGLRDLVDLDALIRTAERDDVDIVKRAYELGLQRPVFYALRYCPMLLGTPLTKDAVDGVRIAGPNRLVLAFMDFLFVRALMPMHPSCDDKWTGLARWLLYVRSHWLKMPWYLLLPHLSRKAWMRLIGKNEH